MKKQIYPKYITKVNIKPKALYTSSENIIFYTLSFAALYGLIYALCMILTFIDAITF